MRSSWIPRGYWLSRSLDWKDMKKPEGHEELLSRLGFGVLGGIPLGGWLS
jgi:hypothetical protein